ncbi:MAG: efflux RND transporter periplasmic adaptor subunit [Phycisphaerales bacterium]|nr:MAG: efflux RND transporter periplasmic adaptor subunit [Phycisphaerales bacterium]
MKRERGIRILVVTVALAQLVLASQGQSGQMIREAGRLQPVESHMIRSQVPRPTVVLYVAPEGKAVERGDLLVELDSSVWDEEKGQLKVRFVAAVARLRKAEEALPLAKEESRAAVELAEQGFRLAKLALEVYVGGEYPQQVAEAEAAVSDAEAQYVEAGERLARLKASEDETDTDRVRQTEAARAQAASQMKVAKNRLRLLTDVMHEFRKASLQLVVMEKEFALMRARNEAKRAEREAESALEIAQARLAMEENRREALEETIHACKLHAPSAGTVQYVRASWGDSATTRPIEPGSIVHKQEPLIQVVETERFKLAVLVDLQVAQQVKTGREVNVRVDAIANETFTGRVAEMRVVPDPASGAAQGLLNVIIENPAKRFRPGMTARVEFEL